ncbi:MAG: peptidase M17, partial [Actinobacteria bacterium]|nr:peptidase M17 [Actinomycetota bacterium]
AAVIGTFCAVAAAKLPVNVVGLIPATDNRLNNNALVPGDVITISNGSVVDHRTTGGRQ